jgi:hypothetical protein
MVTDVVGYFYYFLNIENTKTPLKLKNLSFEFRRIHVFSPLNAQGSYMTALEVEEKLILM